MSRRAWGLAALGFAIGGLPGTLLAVWASGPNPLFLDDKASFVAIALLPLATVGLALGRLIGGWLGGGRLALAAGALLILVQGGLLERAASRPTWSAPVATRLLVFGLDGAPWSLVDRLELPSVQSLKARGAAATLVAEPPLFSPLLWTTLATGKRPEDHGVHGFRVRADACQAARFWDVATFHGLSVGSYKWLVSWPPVAPRAGGFVVPAWLAPDAQTVPDSLSFIKEIELSRRLKRKKVDAVRPAWRLALAGIPEGLRWSTLLAAARLSLDERLQPPPPPLRAARLQLLRVQMDRDVFIAQLHQEQPDLATFSLYSTDALGHTHWGFMEAGGEFSDLLPAAYRQADAVLGEVLAQLGPQATVIVVSDHGFRALNDADLNQHLTPTTEHLSARLREAVGPVEVARLGAKLVVTLLDDASGTAEARRPALVAALDALTQGSTGEPFFRQEEVPGAPRAVGLALQPERLPADALQTETVGGEPLSEFVTFTERYSGEHDAAGLLLAAGPGVPAGVTLGEVSQLDLAPTVLGLLGLPAAEDMPGTALFGEPLQRVPTYDALAPGTAQQGVEAVVNEEALRALGYME